MSLAAVAVDLPVLDPMVSAAAFPELFAQGADLETADLAEAHSRMAGPVEEASLEVAEAASPMAGFQPALLVVASAAVVLEDIANADLHQFRYEICRRMPTLLC